MDLSVSTYKAYSNFCKSTGLTQSIAEPTCVSDKSQTTIDLILVSVKVNISNSGVIKYGISDHFLIYCTRKVYRKVFACHKTVNVHSFKNYSVDILRAHLEKVNWPQVTNARDVDEAWGVFKYLFLQVMDTVAPCRQIRIKQRTNPWFDHSILEMIKKRDSALARFKQSLDQTDFESFKKYRNSTQEMIRIAKRNYCSEIINDNSSNPS